MEVSEAELSGLLPSAASSFEELNTNCWMFARARGAVVRNTERPSLRMILLATLEESSLGQLGEAISEETAAVPKLIARVSLESNKVMARDLSDGVAVM